MKAIRIILLVLIIIGLGLLFTQNSWVPKMVDLILTYEKGKPVDNAITTYIPTATDTEQTLADGKYCFSHSKTATDTEPYNIKEEIILNINGEKVLGTKSGTQNGPDMTNGYTGTLEGIKKINNFELLYSYTVEGSQNKELEIYEFSNSSLFKNRYVLVEKDGILMPDKTSEAKMIEYKEIACL